MRIWNQTEAPGRSGARKFLLTGALLVALVAPLGLLTACFGPFSSSSKPVLVRREIQHSDRRMDWAMVYYQSWRRDRDALYLRMARQHIVEAINMYFQLQVKMGHSYPDFYIVDRKRRQGCRFLDQMEREATRFSVELEETDQSGCLR